MGVAIESANEFETMLQVDSITLVKWPIKQLTMMDGSPLQCYVPLNGMHYEHSDVCNKDNHANVTNEVNVAPTSTKRHYTFINRIPKHSTWPTSAFYVSRESLQRISCIDCCAKKCCQLVDCDVLMRMRQDLW